MNTFINEEKIYEAAEIKTALPQTSNKTKISGMLSVAFACLAVISIFVPFVSAFLFWNFLLVSAALAVLGFLEINSGKSWINNIAWLVSLVSLLLLFVFAFDSFQNPQSLYFYGAFSVIVPVLMTTTALTAKKTAVWRAFLPLVIPVFFIVSSAFLTSRKIYPAFLMLPFGWGLLGFLNYLETERRQP